jgi:hypothetical protein
MFVDINRTEELNFLSSPIFVESDDSATKISD